MDNFFFLSAYLKYHLLATHAGGHGIHSPFVFDFVTKLLEDDREYYTFADIENRRSELLRSTRTLSVSDLGTGALHKPTRRSVSSIARNTLIERRCGELLFKIIDTFACKTILELGTSLGISTAYLAAAHSKAQVISVEGCPQIYEMATETVQQLNLKNIELLLGDFDEHLPAILQRIHTLDFAYFDGNHAYAPTLRYFEACLTKRNPNSIFVFDDIYWSKEMNRAWKYIKAHPEVVATVDIFQMGFVFFRAGMQKQDFVIKY